MKSWIVVVAVAAVAVTTVSAQTPATWTYSTVKDQMTGATRSHAAEVRSADGGATFFLLWWPDEKRFRAVLGLRSGLSDCSRSCVIRLRVDEGTVQSIDAAESRDYRFIGLVGVREWTPFIEAVRKAKQFRVEVPIVRRGRVMFVFEPASPLRGDWPDVP